MFRCDSDLPASFNRHFPARKYVGYRRDGPRVSTLSARLFVLTSSTRCTPSPPHMLASEPRCTFSPYLLQVSVTQHSSVTLRQLSFGEATSRPHRHAAPEGPLSSFWGYVRHWGPSGRCYFPHAFFVLTLLHNRHMPYLQTVISVKSIMMVVKKQYLWHVF